MKSQLFKRVIVPALGVEHTAMLAISTPDDEFNYFSELLELKRPDGTPLFHLIQVGLACQACLDASRGHECVHKVDELVPWKSGARMKLVQSILGDDPETHLRENMGIIISGRKFMFEAIWIKRLIESKPYAFANRVDFIHMAIDPSGGGTGSDYAIVSLAFENGRDVVGAFGLAFFDSQRHVPLSHVRCKVEHRAVALVLLALDELAAFAGAEREVVEGR